MNLAPSGRALRLADELRDFVDTRVRPAEDVCERQLRESGDPHHVPAVVEELKAEARKRGLWNLFLPPEEEVDEPGLRNVDYAPLAEITGASLLAPEALNCSAPDSGNMEILARFGTDEQRRAWLRPLLEGRARSAFMMTEPDVASSDATNIQCRIERDGDDYVISGRKWWITGALDPRCRVAIVMGKTDPDGSPHRQQSMVLVPMDAPGVEVVRDLEVFGFVDRSGHAEVRLDGVRVPRSNLLGEEGGGFAIAQARLGPGRIHHCMRSIGAAERGLELLCRRTRGRVAFGRPLAEQGVVREWIADSRIEIDQVRLLVMRAAWLIDEVGGKGARAEIAAIKVAAPNVALRVLDRAIQAHGGGGVCQDFPLARLYALQRTLRLADGPDEVHRRTVATSELRKYDDGAP